MILLPLGWKFTDLLYGTSHVSAASSQVQLTCRSQNLPSLMCQGEVNLSLMDKQQNPLSLMCQEEVNLFSMPIGRGERG